MELGFHLCYGAAQLKHFEEPADAGKLLQLANALTHSLDRPLNWIHMPVPRGRDAETYLEPLGDLRLRPETQLFLGLVHLTDGAEGARRRIQAARRFVQDFGVATECGWGRRAPQTIPALIELHREVSAPLVVRADEPAPVFEWPAGFDRIPDEDWTRQPVDSFGLAYDTVEHHGWYKNLDPTVEDLARSLQDGDLLVDYSGGTGILLDRLKLRIFDRQIGMLIVDSSAKFLRVSLEKFQDDPRVGLRVIRFSKDQKRLQYLDEVLGADIIERGVNVIASTNAIHLYSELPATLASWVRSVRPGGSVFINSATSGTRAPGPTSGSWTKRCGSSTRWRRGWCARIPVTRPIANTWTIRSVSPHITPTAIASSWPRVHSSSIWGHWRGQGSMSRRSAKRPSRRVSRTGSS